MQDNKKKRNVSFWCVRVEPGGTAVVNSGNIVEVQSVRAQVNQCC